MEACGAQKVTVASETLQHLLRVDDRLNSLSAMIDDRLNPITSESSPSTQPDPPKESRAYPAFFSQIRSNLESMEKSLARIEEIIERLEV